MPPALPRALTAGELVGFNDDVRPRLAVVVGVKGSKVDLRVGFEAKSQQRPMRQLDLIAPLPAEARAPDKLSQPPWLLTPELLSEAQPARRELGAAWLLLQDDPSPQELVDFVGLVGDGGDPSQRAACWLWLQGDQQLFRWRHQRVEPRPVAELSRLRRQQKMERLQEQRRQHWHDLLRQRQPLNEEALDPLQRDQLLQLREWAAGDTERPLNDELRRALQVAHCPIESGGIRHLLVDLGQWQRHHLPSLERTTWDAGFSDELQAEAERLLASAADPQPGDGERSDRTGLHTVTIDDDDTNDIDDGLALQELEGGGLRLWIHIADPGRLVAAGSPLDLEARRRGASLYLAQGSLPMFPLPLASGPFSLRRGQRCAAWSIWVELDGDGAVEHYGIERSWVQPAYRLSYHDVDELLELAPPQEAYLGVIHGLLERRRRWRMARGALRLDQPEGRIRCDGDTAQLEITEPTAARLMVAEAMVLAGAVVAEHGQRHGLALPYRSQLPAELPTAAELEPLPPGPVRHTAIKRCLVRGHVGTTPSPHFSLGLEAYVQATSPIRRYGDLLVQRQLLAQSRGEPALSEAELAELLTQLEAPVKQGIQISREDQRHWQQVWFEQQRQPEWRAVFLRWLRMQDRLGLVHVDELAMDLAAECPANSQPADALLLRVHQVDALRDLLKLQAVG